MRRPSTRRVRRAAFTLVELLVVMALIATLAAITTGAVFRVQAAQRKSFTEATVQKVDSLLLQKLKTIQEQIRDRIKPIKGRAEADAMAGGQQFSDVGDAILMYMHTRNQLPMTFAEATSTITFGTLTLQPLPVFTGAQPPLVGGNGSANESAVCLYLALSQLGNNGLEQQIGEVTVGANTYKCYIDSYGSPLSFNRLAYTGDNGELDSPPFVKAPVANNTFDPFYPKQNSGAYQDLSTALGANVNTLWTAVRPVTNNNWAGTPGNYPGKKNHTTTVISAGADKDLLGLGLYSGDNIVSYRLRKEGAKGD